MSYKVSMVIERDRYRYFAFSPEIEGCQTEGESLDEVILNLKQTIQLYLEAPTGNHGAA